jgi:hypothetical protein
MTDINVAIEQTPYNPCAVRFRPGKHWLVKLARGEATLDWFMDQEARPSADDAVLSIEQATAFVGQHLTLESFAKAAKLPLARASDRAQAEQSRQYLLWVAERWRLLCARPVVTPLPPKVVVPPPPPPPPPVLAWG